MQLEVAVQEESSGPTSNCSYTVQEERRNKIHISFNLYSFLPFLKFGFCLLVVKYHQEYIFF